MRTLISALVLSTIGLGAGAFADEAPAKAAPVESAAPAKKASTKHVAKSEKPAATPAAEKSKTVQPRKVKTVRRSTTPAISTTTK